MDFENASLQELKQFVKDNGIKGVSALKKKELAEYLTKHYKSTGSDRHEKVLEKAEVSPEIPSKKMPEKPDDVSSDVHPEVRSAKEPMVSGKKPDDREEQESSGKKPVISLRTNKKPENRVRSGNQYRTNANHQPNRKIREQQNTYENSKTASAVDVGGDKIEKQEDRQQAAQHVQSGQPGTQHTQSGQQISQPAQDGAATQSNQGSQQTNTGEQYNQELDSGRTANGILEVMQEGYGFIRSANYLPGDQDIYVSPAQIRRFGLKTGDIIYGNIRIKTQGEKFSALLYVNTVNGEHPSAIANRKAFEDLTPIFPNERIKMDGDGAPVPIRMIDLLSPIGKGQRGMIVSPPKTGKTTLLKQIAKCISTKYTDINLLVLLIDERPEEVTDIRESIEGPNVEVIYSTFDELPEHHKRVSEMVIERAKRLVEQKKDVVILLDSITRLARAYNLTVSPSGRTLSGGLDPAALHMPKKFFGAARNMREGGSLTILSTALVETGSKMDDVVFEEFKGTGNMEVVLDRKLSEKRIFPAVDIAKSGTRRDDLLLTKEEQEVVEAIHKALSTNKAEDILEDVLKLFVRTKNNEEFMHYVRKSLIRRY